MVSVHVVRGVAVVAICVGAAGLGFVSYRRGGGAGPLVAHALTLAQTALIAQAALGLLLLSDGRRSPERLHYTVPGALALGVALSPWFYARAKGPGAALVRGDDPRRGGARGAGVHDGVMRRLWDSIPPLARGIGIVALIAAVVVVLQLQAVVATVGGLLQIGSSSRSRSSSSRSGASGAATSRVVGLEPQALLCRDHPRGVAIGLFIGYGLPGTRDALALVATIAACAFVAFRTWRLEHRFESLTLGATLTAR